MRSSNEITEVELHEFLDCPARKLCPLRDICASEDERTKRLIYPKVLKVSRGDRLWTSHYAEDRVLIFRRGVFLAIGHSNQGREVPFCLYGTGNSAGFSDMFTVEGIRDTYHVRTLLKGEVCSFSADMVKKQLNRLPNEYVQSLAISTLVSQCAGAFSISVIKNQKSLTDKITALLYCFNDLTSRTGAGETVFNITHEDIASIVGADRTATTRVLHKLSIERVIDMKYGNVTMLPESLSDPNKKREFHTNLILSKDLIEVKEEMIKNQRDFDYGSSSEVF